MASSGIAATLLEGGRTAHATFKLPLDLTHNESPTCNISKVSSTGQLLQKCDLIIWDECTMSHKCAFGALDRSLQDIRQSKCLFGNVVMVIAGDFRQTLPVVQRGTRADQVTASLKASPLWTSVIRLQLTTNMRARIFGDKDAGQFAERLPQLGEGRVGTDEEGLITLAPIANIASNRMELRDKVFPQMAANYNNLNWLCERAILAPSNADVQGINDQRLTFIPGEAKVYKSVDTVTDPSQAVNYPTEFLNALSPSGLPPHIMLKIGAPVILLRNLDPTRLCNGTWLCIKQVLRHIIEATIITGCAKGQNVFIPRILLMPSDTPFDFRRLQLPLKLCFAMSINKAHGQSLRVAGVDLTNKCFSHGQLYVACSRVGSHSNLHIQAPQGKTENVVYKETLQN